MNRKVKICILIVVLLAAASMAAATAIHFMSTDHPIAQVYQDGQLVRTIDLKTVDQAYEFTLEGGNGAYNIVRVEPGKIAIIEASCPDKVCVNTGYISDSLMPITCLPNRVIIRIESGNEKGPQESTAIDGFSH